MPRMPQPNFNLIYLCISQPPRGLQATTRRPRNRVARERSESRHGHVTFCKQNILISDCNHAISGFYFGTAD